MRRTTSRPFSLLVRALLAGCALGCGGSISEVASDEPLPTDIPPASGATPRPAELGPATVTVPVFVPDDPALPVATLQDACRLWEGLECELVDTQEEALLHFFVDSGGCLPNDDGSFTIGRHRGLVPGRDHRITLYVQCMAEIEGLTSDQPVSYGLLRNVIAHEVGHALGMIRHVAYKCDDSDLVNPVFEDELGLVCGAAIMNPFVDASLAGPTEMDLRNFALRQSGYLYPYAEGEAVSLLPKSGNVPVQEPDCTLTTGPK